MRKYWVVLAENMPINRFHNITVEDWTNATYYTVQSRAETVAESMRQSNKWRGFTITIVEATITITGAI